jgi:hypothetical protein
VVAVWALVYVWVSARQVPALVSVGLGLPSVAPAWQWAEQVSLWVAQASRSVPVV